MRMLSILTGIYLQLLGHLIILCLSFLKMMCLFLSLAVLGVHGFSCGEQRNVRTEITEMLTDHAKRSCVMEDVLIKMSLHCSSRPISYETSWN